MYIVANDHLRGISICRCSSDVKWPLQAQVFEYPTPDGSAVLPGCRTLRVVPHRKKQVTGLNLALHPGPISVTAKCNTTCSISSCPHAFPQVMAYSPETLSTLPWVPSVRCLTTMRNWTNTSSIDCYFICFSGFFRSIVIKPKALCMLDKQSALERHSQTYCGFILEIFKVLFTTYF